MHLKLYSVVLTLKYLIFFSESIKFQFFLVLFWTVFVIFWSVFLLRLCRFMFWFNQFWWFFYNVRFTQDNYCLIYPKIWGRLQFCLSFYLPFSSDYTSRDGYKSLMSGPAPKVSKLLIKRLIGVNENLLESMSN